MFPRQKQQYLKNPKLKKTPQVTVFAIDRVRASTIQPSQESLVLRYVMVLAKATFATN